MRLPFEFLPVTLANGLQSKLGLFLIGILTLILGEPMRAHSDALIGPAAPLGILSLQFACSTDAAKTILEAWDSHVVEHVRLSLYWDMGFAPAYGIALTALTQRFLAYRARRGRQLVIFAWLPIWAALADWLENLLHLCLISANGCGDIHFYLPTLACSAALFKWCLLSIWLIGLGWIALLGKRFKPAFLDDHSD